MWQRKVGLSGLDKLDGPDILGFICPTVGLDAAGLRVTPTHPTLSRTTPPRPGRANREENPLTEVLVNFFYPFFFHDFLLFLAVAVV